MSHPIKEDPNARIPTAEIEQDILDTEREIAQLEEEAEHFENTPRSVPEYRFNMLKASARRSGIVERLEFVLKLKLILQKRKENEEKRS